MDMDDDIPLPEFAGDDNTEPHGTYGHEGHDGRSASQAVGATRSSGIADLLKAVIVAAFSENLMCTDALRVFAQLRKVPSLGEAVSDELWRSFEALIESVEDLSSSSSGMSLDIYADENFRKGVASDVLKLIDVPTSTSPPTSGKAQALASQLRTTVENHWRETYAGHLERAARDFKPASVQRALWERLPEPITEKSARLEPAETVARFLQAAEADSTPRRRFSSGFPTLDSSMTRSSASGGFDEALGFIGAGEGICLAGLTGTGKSSMSYMMVPALAQDLSNQGLAQRNLFYAHTEEDTLDKIRGFQMMPNQRYHHLAHGVVAKNVGSSREAFITEIYRNVAEADDAAKRTGAPIEQFVFHVVVLDYLQSLSSPGEASGSTESILRTAELLLRGIQMFNHEEMAKHSGLSYEEVTGRTWPSGLERHQVACIYFAQFRKRTDIYFEKTAKSWDGFSIPVDESYPLAKFNGPDGQSYAWEVRPGDLRVMDKSEIKGGSTVLDNATSVLFLHRSAPNTTVDPTPGADGKLHLRDQRARLIVGKSRTGKKLEAIPMRFDLDAEGFRASYFDPIGEQAVALGKLKVHESYRDVGDPMLPVRHVPTAFETLRY